MEVMKSFVFVFLRKGQKGEWLLTATCMEMHQLMNIVNNGTFSTLNQTSVNQKLDGHETSAGKMPSSAAISKITKRS